MLGFTVLRRQFQIGACLVQFTGMHQRQRHIVVSSGGRLIVETAELTPGGLIAENVGCAWVITALVGTFPQLGIARHLVTIGINIRLINLCRRLAAGERTIGQQQGNPRLHHSSFPQ
ncbi:hypothetical protein D3C73_1122650 [compost metagenome]